MDNILADGRLEDVWKYGDDVKKSTNLASICPLDPAILGDFDSSFPPDLGDRGADGVSLYTF